MGLDVIIINLILAVPTFFLCRLAFRRIGDERTRQITTYLTTLVLTPLIYVGLIIGWVSYVSYYPERDFDKDKWETDIEKRYEMTGDLIDNGKLIGKTKEQIKELLGQEDVSLDGSRWTYYIGFKPSLFGIDPDVLESMAQIRRTFFLFLLSATAYTLPLANMPAGQITYPKEMMRLTIKFTIGLLLINSIKLDSCGLDINPRLNKFEIAYLDNVLLADSVFDFKKGFTLKNKNIAFFSCDSDKISDGFITKETLFDILKESGHKRPRGISIPTDKQKQVAGQLDAIVLIDCKAYSDDALITKLKQRTKENNLIPGQ